MFPAALSERLDALIDDLILDGGIEAASLASILLTAKDSIKRDDHLTLSRKVWTANNELLATFTRNEEACGVGDRPSDLATPHQCLPE